MNSRSSTAFFTNSLSLLAGSDGAAPVRTAGQERSADWGQPFLILLRKTGSLRSRNVALPHYHLCRGNPGAKEIPVRNSWWGLEGCGDGNREGVGLDGAALLEQLGERIAGNKAYIPHAGAHSHVHGQRIKVKILCNLTLVAI